MKFKNVLTIFTIFNFLLTLTQSKHKLNLRNQNSNLIKNKISNTITLYTSHKSSTTNKNLNKFLHKLQKHFIYNDPDSEIILDKDIKYYKSPCGCVKIPVPVPPKPHGHYEKRIVNTEHYIFVPGHQPSGLPGAFVVSDEEAHGKMHSMLDGIDL